MDNIEKVGNTLYNVLNKEQKMQMYRDIIDNVRDNTICKIHKFNKETLSILEQLLKDELVEDYFLPELKQTIEVRLLVLNKNLELYKNKYLDIPQ